MRTFLIQTLQWALYDASLVVYVGALHHATGKWPFAHPKEST